MLFDSSGTFRASFGGFTQGRIWATTRVAEEGLVLSAFKIQR